MNPELEILQSETRRLASELSQSREINKTLQQEIAILKDRISWFERQIFGQKTERYITCDTQTSLDLGVSSITPEVVQSHIEYTRTTNKKVTPHGRDELPSHLPRIKNVIKPDFDTTGLTKIYDKITEELHYTPAKFCVLQNIRPVFAGMVNGERTVLCPPLPPRCIEKGKAGASVVAQTIVTKCVDHNPLYRFNEQIRRYCDMDLPYSTVNGWYSQGIFWLEPVARRLHELALASKYVQLDESTVRVMIQPTKGKSHQGYMHVCHAPEPGIVTFTYHHTRNVRYVRKLLGEEYRGIVQTDGLNIYDFLSESPDIVYAGCGAHGRRGFKEALGNDRDRAQFVLDKYKILFDVEARAKELSLNPEQRLEFRREHSAATIHEMKTWLEATSREVTPKSLIGKAVAYLLNRWPEMVQFLNNGRIELSNNAIENLIRTLALGRKNWLFAGSENGAQRLATAYSVLGTCKLHDVNPFEYLCSVLETIPGRTAGNIDDLLPMNWKRHAQ